jgi:virginiamycin A acetyltransferase
MKVRLNEQSLEWLCDMRIYFQGYRATGHRLKARGFLQWANFPPVIEPYIGIYSGDQICSLGSFTYTFSTFPLFSSIGRYCSIATNVRFPGPRHPHELLSTSGFITGGSPDMWTSYLNDTNQTFRSVQPSPQKHAPIVGNDVWIGQDVTIMSGLKIGDGAVVAAASVVTRDVAPFAIVGGNPAQFIRWRFPEDVREELADLRWWRYGFATLDQIDLSDVRNSMRDLRSKCADAPAFEPSQIDLWQMPHDGIVAD